MPEGDTVFLSAARLHKALAGRPVTRFDLRVPALALADLRGSVVTEVVPRGKHILMRFSTEQTLHSHLRMDGSWRVAAAGSPPPGREFELRALVGNDEWFASGFRVHDLALLPTREEGEFVGHLGPDLLAADYDADEALRRLSADPERAISDALLDQRVVAGIGNVYKSELLFLNRTNPWTRVGDVGPLEHLLVDARRLLKGNVGQFNRSTTGFRQPGQQYWVYGRSGKACRRCRAGIARLLGEANTDRVTYWCPRCQPAPTGQPQVPPLR